LLSQTEVELLSTENVTVLKLGTRLFIGGISGVISSHKTLIPFQPMSYTHLAPFLVSVYHWLKTLFHLTFFSMAASDWLNPRGVMFLLTFHSSSTHWLKYGMTEKRKR